MRRHHNNLDVAGHPADSELFHDDEPTATDYELVELNDQYDHHHYHHHRTSTATWPDCAGCAFAVCVGHRRRSLGIDRPRLGDRQHRSPP